MPKVSVIIPVYNSEKYLEEGLQCIMNQTLEDIEIICIDDASDDSSLQILNKYAQLDSRITVLSQKHGGAGKARNLGFSKAVGEYTYFFDSDDLCDLTLLEKTVQRADETASDIIAFHFTRFFEDGSEVPCIGFHSDWLSSDVDISNGEPVFNYKNCPDRILSIINPTPWNKLYRTDFLRENSLHYEEISSTNDITFAAISVACAQKISCINQHLLKYRVGHENTITSTKSKKLHNVIHAVSSAVCQASALPYHQLIHKAIQWFALDNYIFAFEHYATDFRQLEVKAYYEHIHAYFSGSEFDTFVMDDFGTRHRWSVFQAVRKHNYESMRHLKARQIIISFTTYPARINGLEPVLESIFEQTLQPDRIILWLAGEQFPGLDNDLPEYLIQYKNSHRLDIQWCDDLKPHKKYYYALQKYPNDVIVTIDDDIVYSKDMIQALYDSYLLYPDAISAMRVHLITVSKTDETILPYRYWIKEADAFIHEPSMYFLATGGAGTLYPPGTMNSYLFDKQAILNTCLYADDLWLKTMQLLNNTPVVLASEYTGLNFVPNSQAEALYKKNENQNENDLQLSKIIQWLDTRFEQGIWYKKLTQSDYGSDFSDVTSMCECFFRLHERLKQVNRESGQKLKIAFAEKSEINQKLQTAYREKSEINRKLQTAYREKSEINRKLQITYHEKSEINQKLQVAYQEKSDLGEKVKKLQIELREKEVETEQIYNSTTYKIGRLILYIPKKIKNLLSKSRRS